VISINQCLEMKGMVFVNDLVVKMASMVCFESLYIDVCKQTTANEDAST